MAIAAANTGDGGSRCSCQRRGWGWLLQSSTLVVRVLSQPLMLVVVVATVDAPAAGICQPIVINAGAGMAAVAVDAGDGGTCCQGWGPS